MNMLYSYDRTLTLGFSVLSYGLFKEAYSIATTVKRMGEAYSPLPWNIAMKCLYYCGMYGSPK